MKVVIEIDEEKYEYIKGLDKACTDYRTTLMLYDAVRHGTPLPKGHGRLVDINDVRDRLIPLIFSFQEWVSEVELSNVKTIIKADRSENE